MIIVPCTNAGLICDMMHQAFERYKKDPIPSSALDETAQTIEAELAQGVRVWGGQLDKQLVAIVKVATKSDTLYFSRLSVLPSMQGKGYAKSLIHFIEELAILEKKQYVTCKVRKSETGNIALYHKLGFAIIAEEMIASKDGKAIPTITMQKVL